MNPSALHSGIEALVSPACCSAMRAEIEAVHGSEVFFVGRLDSELVVEEVEAYAFGNRRSVPALGQYARPGDVIIHNHPSGVLEPSDADVSIASMLGEQGIGSYIINNAATELRIIVKASRPKGTQPLDANAMARMLEPGGRLADRLARYEHRPQQIEMMRAVARSLNRDGIAVIEAGTGTGKSMAYLLPALGWAVRNSEKVVISTHTINLQEQIIDKDLPLLKEALGVSFDAVLVKGRGNYLCRRKAEYVHDHPNFFDAQEKRDQIDAIQSWIRTTRDGSLSDLGFTPDPDVWEQFISESDNCLRTQCPHYQSCFFYTARRRAARAQILVVNHHLLMADLALRAETENYTQAAVLPPFHRLIIDEAHHIEDVATSYFGSRVSRGGLVYSLRRLASMRTGEGLLRYVARKLSDRLWPMPEGDAADLVHRVSMNLMELHHQLVDAVEECADRTAITMDELHGGSLDRAMEQKQRLTPGFTQSVAWHGVIEPALRSVLSAGRALVEALHKLHQDIHRWVEDETPETMSPLLELQSAAGKIERQLAHLVRFLAGGEADCRWIEHRRRPGVRRPVITFASAPLHVAPQIRDQVLRRFKSVVFTSATLTVQNEFDFFLDQIGAGDGGRLGLITSAALEAPAEVRQGRPRHLETLRVETPFDYDRQVYIGIPIDLPSPKEREFGPALASFVQAGLLASRGRGLVLFTSYNALEQTYSTVAPALEAAGFPCLKQGGIGRSLLTESFRNDIGSSLFATSSFWEGVDVPGEALSCLMLTRLPFAVPGEPILEARVEAIKMQGLDPFEKFIVPRAVIRFRQGFGRLIRSRTDRGAVLICDKRVASTGYGQVFLRSLPTRRIHVGRQPEIIAAAGGFLAAD